MRQNKCLLLRQDRCLLLKRDRCLLLRPNWHTSQPHHFHWPGCWSPLVPGAAPDPSLASVPSLAPHFHWPWAANIPPGILDSKSIPWLVWCCDPVRPIGSYFNRAQLIQHFTREQALVSMSGGLVVDAEALAELHISACRERCFPFRDWSADHEELFFIGRVTTW